MTKGILRNGMDIKVRRTKVFSKRWLAESRTPAFYLEKRYGGEDAMQALSDSDFVYLIYLTFLKFLYLAFKRPYHAPSIPEGKADC